VKLSSDLAQVVSRTMHIQHKREQVSLAGMSVVQSWLTCSQINWLGDRGRNCYPSQVLINTGDIIFSFPKIQTCLFARGDCTHQHLSIAKAFSSRIILVLLFTDCN